MNPLHSLRFLILTLVSAVAAQAQTSVTLNYQITINQVFLSNGTTTAVLSNPTYTSRLATFQDATQKIFAQAGIKVNWQTPETLTSAQFYVLDNTTEYESLVRPSNPTSVKQDSTYSVLNLYYVSAYGASLGGSSAWGLSEQNFIDGSNNYVGYLNGVTVSEAGFSANSIDLLAHEIGHNLTLTHNVLPANTVALGVSNLMYSGNTNVTSLNDIYSPGGTGLQRDQLDTTQKSRLQNLYTLAGSSFSFIQPLAVPETYYYSAIPEPATSALIAGALLGSGACGWRMRRRSRQKSIE